MAQRSTEPKDEIQGQGQGQEAAPAPMPATVVYMAAPPEKSEKQLEIERLQEKLLLSQLRKAEIEEEQAIEVADKFKNDKRSKAQKQAAAQESLNGERILREGLKSQCNHRQGGTMDNYLRGDGPTSLVLTSTCLPGHEHIICVKCLGEWDTPQPSLARTKPRTYKRAVRVFERMKRRALNGKNLPIGTPMFSFVKNGVPFVPERI